MTPADILKVLQAEAPDVEWSVTDGYVKEIVKAGSGAV